MVVVLALGACGGDTPPPEPSPDGLTGRLLVKAVTLADAQAALTDASADASVLDASGGGAVVLTTIDVGPEIAELGWVVIEPPPDALGAVMAVLASDKRIIAVEAEGTMRLIEPMEATPTGMLELDPAVGQQWHHARVRSAGAWERGLHGDGVVIAIIDTGIDCTHPDLAAACVAGRDFTGIGSPNDDHGHGTHVAGIAAAVGGNGQFGAGMADHASVMPLKVLTASGSGSYTVIASGIAWAANAGATVMNLSLGGSTDAQIIRDAVKHAATRGTTCVAAAGNDGTANPGYPAAYPECISVAATTQSDTATDWTTYGPTVDVAFPGLNIYSTKRFGGMVTMSGTSMASPGVAGLFGQCRSRADAPTCRTKVTTIGQRLTTGRLANLVRPDAQTIAESLGDPIPATPVPTVTPGGPPTATLTSRPPSPTPGATRQPGDTACRVGAVDDSGVTIVCPYPGQ